MNHFYFEYMNVDCLLTFRETVIHSHVYIDIKMIGFIMQKTKNRKERKKNALILQPI